MEIESEDALTTCVALGELCLPSDFLFLPLQNPKGFVMSIK